jgi:hypothetical protein
MKIDTLGEYTVGIDRAKPKKRNPPGEVINCGKEEGYCFCILYAFTSKGLKRFSGSLGNIESMTNVLPLCHGVIHYYNFGVVVGKRWDLFGDLSKRSYITDNAHSVNLEYVRSGKRPYGREASLIGKQKQSRYYLIVHNNDSKEIDVIASWRKLPSCFIKEFIEIERQYGGKKILR